MRFIKALLGGLIGSFSVWLGLYFFFHFDTWSERLISIFLLTVGISLFCKLVDKFFPM